MRGPKSFDLEDMQLLRDGVRIVEKDLVVIESDMSELCRSWYATSLLHETKIKKYLSDYGLDNRLYVHVEYFQMTPYRQSLALREIKGVAWNPTGFEDDDLDTAYHDGLTELLSLYVKDREKISADVVKLSEEHEQNYDRLDSLSVIFSMT